MLLPETLLGSNNSVNSKLNRILIKYKEPRAFIEEINQSLVKYEPEKCLIIIDTHKLKTQSEHHHLYIPLRKLNDFFKKNNNIFAQQYLCQNKENQNEFLIKMLNLLISQDWSLLALMSPNNSAFWFDLKLSKIIYIKSLIERWNEFQSLGEVFINLPNIEPRCIWCNCGSLRYVLNQIGVPNNKLLELSLGCIDKQGLYKRIEPFNLNELLISCSVAI